MKLLWIFKIHVLYMVASFSIQIWNVESKLCKTKPFLNTMTSSVTPLCNYEHFLHACLGKGRGANSKDNISSNTWWRHQMETFYALLAVCAGNSPVTGLKGQWRGALMFSLISAWINNWVKNLKAGNLRRYRAHYDVTVMFIIFLGCTRLN